MNCYRASRFLLVASFIACFTSCNKQDHSVLLVSANPSVLAKSAYPTAVDPKRVGTYPSETKSGAGYFYDDVLEYRVWFYPEGGGDDKYAAFSQYEPAESFSKSTKGAEEPLVLVRQGEWIDEPKPGQYIPRGGERLTEWDVRWLAGSKRADDSITEFMKHPRPPRN